MIKHIIFDCFGTLIDTGTGSKDAVEQILRNVGSDADARVFYKDWKKIIDNLLKNRIPINIRTENRNLPGGEFFKIINLAGLDIALRVNVNTCGLVINLDIARRLHNLVKLVPPLLDVHAPHLKRNDNISLFDEGVVQIAAVHTGITGGADRSGRRRQALDFGGHILVCCCGHVDLVAVPVFQNQFEKHGFTPLQLTGGCCIIWVYAKRLNMRSNRNLEVDDYDI